MKVNKANGFQTPPEHYCVYSSKNKKPIVFIFHHNMYYTLLSGELSYSRLYEEL